MYAIMVRPRKYSNAKIISALKKKKGMVYLAASMLGCDANTIYDRAKVTPAIATLILHENGKVDDTAEMKLLQAINKGQPWAIAFRLSRKGKHRGYTEKVENVLTGADGEEIKLKHSGEINHRGGLTADDLRFSERLARDAVTDPVSDPVGPASRNGVHTNGSEEPLDHGEEV